MYAKTLIPGPHAVPALMATTDDADILLPQLLDRGWALFGEPLPTAAAGRLVVGSDRLQLVVGFRAVRQTVSPGYSACARHPAAKTIGRRVRPD